MICITFIFLMNQINYYQFLNDNNSSNYRFRFCDVNKNSIISNIFLILNSYQRRYNNVYTFVYKTFSNKFTKRIDYIIHSVIFLILTHFLSHKSNFFLCFRFSLFVKIICISSKLFLMLLRIAFHVLLYHILLSLLTF